VLTWKNSWILYNLKKWVKAKHVLINYWTFFVFTTCNCNVKSLDRTWLDCHFICVQIQMKVSTLGLSNSNYVNDAVCTQLISCNHFPIIHLFVHSYIGTKNHLYPVNKWIKRHLIFFNILLHL